MSQVSPYSQSWDGVSLDRLSHGPWSGIGSTEAGSGTTSRFGVGAVAKPPVFWMRTMVSGTHRQGSAGRPQ